MSEDLPKQGSWFQRILLPGFVFKGVVIGGGYATGRELVEFFFASGPRGALYGILLATAIWSIVCAVSFLFAQAVRGYDYRAFFKELLGPFWVLFEIAYLALIILIIAVIAAAITPTVDPVNMGLVMAPMILLYFISIGLSYLAYAGRRRNAEAQEPASDVNLG